VRPGLETEITLHCRREHAAECANAGLANVLRSGSSASREGQHMTTQQSTVLPSADSLLDRIPNWLGIGLIVLVGILAVVFGALDGVPGLIAFGLAATASAILAWVDGARSRPTVGFEKSGATVRDVEAWVWLIVLGPFLAATAVAVLAR